MAVMGVFVGNVFRRQMRLARLKTDLVAAVSHELKTPLASMRLLVDSLLEYDDTPLDPVKTREYLQLISGENLRLTRLIENFLTFSRIERNRQRFDFAPVNPAGVIHAAAHVCESACRRRLAASRSKLLSDLPLLHADEDALITVLLNLIDNAYKYTPSGKEWTNTFPCAPITPQVQWCLRCRGQRYRHRPARPETDLSALLPSRPAPGSRNRRLRPGAEHRGVHRARPRRIGARHQPARRRQHLHRASSLRNRTPRGRGFCV